jgi:hypothetical protein
VRNAHPPSRFELDRPTGRELCFGIREEAWTKKEFDGVVFTAELRDADGRETPLLRETMHPSAGTLRAPASCRALPAAAAAGTLVLSTQARSTGSYDWAYWYLR